MDTSQPAAIIPRDKQASVAPQRQRRSIAEKRRIVEETLTPGASVAKVARAHGVNANQVFAWRRLYRAGRLGEQKPGIKLLPVLVETRNRGWGDPTPDSFYAVLLGPNEPRFINDTHCSATVLA